MWRYSNLLALADSAASRDHLFDMQQASFVLLKTFRHLLPSLSAKFLKNKVKYLEPVFLRFKLPAHLQTVPATTMFYRTIFKCAHRTHKYYPPKVGV